MATCEQCGADVSPGDIYTVQEGVERHYYCSHAHYAQQIEEARLKKTPPLYVPDPPAASLPENKEEPEPVVEETPKPPAKRKPGRPRKTPAK